MLIDYTFGQTGVIIRAVLRSSTTGLGLTTLTYSSSGLIISTICDVEATATAYTSASSNIVAVTTLGTYAAPASGKCNFSPVDTTNHPGLYEIQIANARLSVTNAKYLIVTISGVTGLADTHLCIPLRQINPYSANSFMTGVNGVAPPTNWNLDSIDSSGRHDIGKWLGNAVTVDTNNAPNVSTKYFGGTAVTGRDLGASVLLSSGTGTGQLSITSGVVSANTTQFGGTSVTGRDIGASVLLSVGTGTGQVNLSSGAVPVTGDLSSTMKASVTTAATAATPTVLLTPGTATGQVSLASGVLTASLSGDLTTTMKASVTTAATAATPTVLLTPGTSTGQVSLTAGVLVSSLSGDLTPTMKSSVTTAATAATPTVTVGTNNDKVGYSLSVSPPTTAQIQTYLDANSTQFASIVSSLATNLDAKVSTRSTYSGADTAGTTTLLGRLAGTILFDGSGFVKSNSQNDPLASTVPGSYGSTTAGYALGKLYGAVVASQTPVTVVADAGNSTTSVLVSGLSTTTAASYIGMQLEFASTAANPVQRQTITNAVAVSTNVRLTLTVPFAVAPATGDTGAVL